MAENKHNKLICIPNNKNNSATNFMTDTTGTKILINQCKIELTFVQIQMKWTITMKKK